jgi:hypothetical protein
MAKSDEDYFNDIRVILEAIKANINNPGRVRQGASAIINICGNLSNQAVANGIRAAAQKIMASYETAEIEAACDEISAIIDAQAGSNAKKPGKADKRCLDPKKILKTDRYSSDCRKYGSQGNIPGTEEKIQRFPYSDHLHGRITAGKWQGYLHARLTGNLRIMYRWDADNKILVYDAIITKNELDQG